MPKIITRISNSRVFNPSPTKTENQLCGSPPSLRVLPMKNPKITDHHGAVTKLPEAIIQHIQSLLTEKEAAQTSILSKPWHTAWSTRPNLLFDQRHCGRYCTSYFDARGFLESVKKTIQRYEKSNLTISSFSLSLDRRDSHVRLLADQLTAKALELGATQLSLSVCLYRAIPIFPVTLNPSEFRNLKVLRLEWLDIDLLFSFDYYDYNVFPCLKILTLTSCFSKRKAGIRVSSHSLECLTLAHSVISLATLDVPNIRKFNFSSANHDITTNHLPWMDFVRASDDWVSGVSIECAGKTLTASWFNKLEKFLEQLSPSEVSLSIDFGVDVDRIVVLDCARDDQGIGRRKPVVENLTVKLPPKYIDRDCEFLKFLFGSCAPKHITQCWEDWQRRGRSWRKDHNSLLKLVCKELKVDIVVASHEEDCFRNTSRFPGLEEVNVECFEEAFDQEWRPLSLNTLLLDASTSLDDKQLIRFRLKWR